jgi:hypothetical protein
MTDEMIEHLREAGRRGGKVQSEKQKKSRMLNLYRGLAKKWPHSVTVLRKLEELEKDEENPGV